MREPALDRPPAANRLRRVATPLAAAAALLLVPAARAATGSVSGTVRIPTPVPEVRPVALGSDHHCVKDSGRRPLQEEVVAGEDGGLANAFVRLSGKGLAAAAGPVPSEIVTIEQRGCVYYPRMTGARAGQTLRVINQDEFFHNVRSLSKLGTDFNISQPYSGMEYDFPLSADQEMVRLDCNIHPWMRAHIGVAPHPWFAVTGTDGRFELAGVPAGTWELTVWHERMGTRLKTVTVEAGGATTVDFELSPDAAKP